MLVNQERRFIFVHIQKTGGMSVEALLKHHFPGTSHWHGRHGHAATALEEIGLPAWNEYFSFAFVRNPWDRLVSWYNMIEIKKTELPWYKWLRPNPLRSRLWNQLLEMRVKSFPEFLERCTDPVFDNGCWKSFAFNQIDYLVDDSGNLVVKHVGRFEDIENEFRFIAEKLAIGRFTLPRRNVRPHGHYRTWYDDRTRRLVAERYARDIDIFGYSF